LVAALTSRRAALYRQQCARRRKGSRTTRREGRSKARGKVAMMHIWILIPTVLLLLLPLLQLQLLLLLLRRLVM